MGFDYCWASRGLRLQLPSSYDDGMCHRPRHFRVPRIDSSDEVVLVGILPYHLTGTMSVAMQGSN